MSFQKKIEFIYNQILRAYLQRKTPCNMNYKKVIKSIFKSQWFLHFLLAQFFLKILRLPHGVFHEKSNLLSHPLEWLHSILFSFYLDLPVIAYYFAPIWILHLIGSKRYKTNHLIFSLLCLLLLVVTAIDFSYYPFTGTHINAGIFKLLADPGNHILPYILSYWYLIPLILLITYGIYIFKNKSNQSLYTGLKHKPLKIAIGILYMGVFIIFARGGFYLKPLRSINIGKFVHPKLISYTNNGPFEIYSTIEGNQEVEPTFGVSDAFDWKKEYSGNSELKNVCILIVESLSQEYLNLDEGSVTPFINTLRTKSTEFKYCFASGRRSKEMPPSLFLGMPKILKDDYISSIYSRNSVKNAFALYQENGYDCSFYHGGANGTLEFESFLKFTGLENYFGMDQYPNPKDYDGAWGIRDRQYLSYYADELGKKKKPFFSSIFTLSSHHPYKLEKPFNKSLKKGPYENSQSIRYIDSSLSLFFKKIENAPWFKNTLFVITADHTSTSKNWFYQYNIGKHWVPFIVYNPANESKQIITKTTAQSDIVPTINKLSGIKGKWFAAGNNALDSTNDFTVMRSDAEYICIQYPYVLYMGFDGKAHEYFRIKPNKKRVKLKLKGDRFTKMMLNTQNYVRQYYSSILNNNWNTNK